jgi:hypothetical protein
MRTANVLPTNVVRRFDDAGLTTLLFSASGDIATKDMKASIDATTNVTGVMDSRLQAVMGTEVYPDVAIKAQEVSPSFQNAFLPLKAYSLTYEHVDNGLNDALQEIIGTQTTVRLSQLREKYAAQLSGRPAEYVRDIATKTANFIARSIQAPPAVVDIHVNPELNLREALIIMDRHPEQIINILDFEVYSRDE